MGSDIWTSSIISPIKTNTNSPKVCNSSLISWIIVTFEMVLESLIILYKNLIKFSP